MIRKNIFLLLFLILASAGASASPGNGLGACEGLVIPFDGLAQMTLDTSVANPPQVQLCHRVANAEKQFRMERAEKSIDELRKYISEVEQSTPRHVEGAYAEALIAEAERVISIISGDVVVEGTISGGVYAFQTNQPVSGALVTVSFSGSEQTYSTTTDGNGFFTLENMPITGAFVVNAADATGAVGSAQGSLLPSESVASVLVTLDHPGSGVIQGHVFNEQAQQTGAVLVTAIFPDSKREYTVIAGVDGYYRFGGVRPDGTVIVIAFDNDSGASASYSTVLTQYYPVATVDLSLVTPGVINSDLTNGNFAHGLTGWTYSGPVQLVERSLVFGAQN